MQRDDTLLLVALSECGKLLIGSNVLVWARDHFLTSNDRFGLSNCFQLLHGAIQIISQHLPVDPVQLSLHPVQGLLIHSNEDIPKSPSFHDYLII